MSEGGVWCGVVWCGVVWALHLLLESLDFPAVPARLRLQVIDTLHRDAGGASTWANGRVGCKGGKGVRRVRTHTCRSGVNRLRQGH